MKGLFMWSRSKFRLLKKRCLSKKAKQAQSSFHQLYFQSPQRQARTPFDGENPFQVKPDLKTGKDKEKKKEISKTRETKALGETGGGGKNQAKDTGKRRGGKQIRQ